MIKKLPPNLVCPECGNYPLKEINNKKLKCNYCKIFLQFQSEKWVILNKKLEDL